MGTCPLPDTRESALERLTGKHVLFAFPPQGCLVWRVVEKHKAGKCCLAASGMVELDEMMLPGVGGEVC